MGQKNLQVFYVKGMEEFDGSDGIYSLDVDRFPSLERQTETVYPKNILQAFKFLF